LSPRPSNFQQAVATEVAVQLTARLGPRAATEIAVYTDRGIRVPDVAWMPPARWAECKGQSPFTAVPDVCVEVLSPGNSREEILMKAGAYLRGGAREVVVVGLRGELEFFGPDGRCEASALGIALALPPELF
jgi:Uma2 family endonuclease